MCFPTEPACGFYAGDGWFGLLHELFAELEKIELPEGFCIERVKQKLCGLRVYPSVYTDKISALIRKAESRAWRTCELCGAEKEYEGAKFGMNLCPECEESRHEAHR